MRNARGAPLPTRPPALLCTFTDGLPLGAGWFPLPQKGLNFYICILFKEVPITFSVQLSVSYFRVNYPLCVYSGGSQIPTWGKKVEQ